ncbi:hypothetical protein X739_22280 [Mesorhizobium sp. LNHC220B00]|nr:hypothetical protein X739_22280 [Mesorhizobium sp. LNHC220B00]
MSQRQVRRWFATREFAKLLQLSFSGRETFIASDRSDKIREFWTWQSWFAF